MLKGPSGYRIISIKSLKSKNLTPKATENRFFEKTKYVSFRGEGFIFGLCNFARVIRCVAETVSAQKNTKYSKLFFKLRPIGPYCVFSTKKPKKRVFNGFILLNVF